MTILEKFLVSVAIFLTAVGAGSSLFSSGGGGGGGSGITTINSDSTLAQTLSVGTSGSDFAISDGGSGAHTFNLPTASASNRGALSSADWIRFNASAVPVNLASGSSVTGSLPVANGGTGTGSLTAHNVVTGNGTSPVNFVAPGSNGNVLTSNGTDWTSAAATGGGSIGVGSTGTNKEVLWQSANGTTSAVQKAGNWGEGSNGEYQYLKSSTYGNATNPIIDINPFSVNGVGGVGMYTDSNGFLYLAAQGGNFTCMRNNNFYFGACSSASGGITGSGGGVTLGAGTADGRTANMAWNSINGVQVTGSAAGGVATLLGGAVGLIPTTQSGASYTVAQNVFFVSMTNTGARTVTLFDANSGSIGSGHTLVIKDAAGVAASAGTSVRIIPNTGHTIDGSNEAYISTNWGTIKLYAKASDWLTW